MIEKLRNIITFLKVDPLILVNLDLFISNFSVFKDLIFRFINGTITIYISPILYNTYNKTQRKFYFFWSGGFAFYGLNIIIRLFLPSNTNLIKNESINLFLQGKFFALAIIAFIFSTAGFAFMVIGIGELITKTRTMLISSLILFIPPIFQLFIGEINLSISMIITIIPYIFLVSSLIIINIKWDLELKMLITGWLLLLLINIGFFTNLIDYSYVDLLSAFSKIVIFWGMTQPKFSFIVDDLKDFIKTSDFEVESHNYTSGFRLLNVKDSNRIREIEWIKDRIRDNSKRGVRTILVIMYDLLLPKDISNHESEESAYFVRVLQGKRGSNRIFERRSITINDDLNQFDILLSDIIKTSREENLPCEVVIFTLSHLIHTHGWKRMYSFITSKIPPVKSSLVKITGVYYPETHENSSDIIKFEKMADRIINY